MGFTLKSPLKDDDGRINITMSDMSLMICLDSESKVNEVHCLLAVIPPVSPGARSAIVVAVTQTWPYFLPSRRKTHSRITETRDFGIPSKRLMPIQFLDKTEAFLTRR